jgi:hypothetical protein
MQTNTRKININSLLLIIAVYFLFTIPSAVFAQEFVAYSAAGIDANAIGSVVNAFRSAVGSPNNGNTPGPLASGRREINWDGGGNNSATAPAPTHSRVSS